MSIFEVVQLLANVLLALGLFCGGLSHFVTPTSKVGKVLNVIGMFTTRAGEALDRKPTEKPSLRSVNSALLVLLVSSCVTGCAPARQIWDTAYDTCVAALRLEPVVIAVAQDRGQDVIQYAKILCNMVEVLDPFVQELDAQARAARTARPSAVDLAIEAAEAKQLL
jgi:hypothetical protein